MKRTRDQIDKFTPIAVEKYPDLPEDLIAGLISEEELEIVNKLYSWSMQFFSATSLSITDQKRIDQDRTSLLSKMKELGLSDELIDQAEYEFDNITFVSSQGAKADFIRHCKKSLGSMGQNRLDGLLKTFGEYYDTRNLSSSK